MRTFTIIEELRQAPLEFRETYNTTWLIERHGFISPAGFRQQQLQPIANGGVAFNPVFPENRGRYSGQHEWSEPPK